MGYALLGSTKWKGFGTSTSHQNETGGEDGSDLCVLGATLTGPRWKLN